MKFCSPYTTKLMDVDSLQRWILVQSIIYYELNNSVVSDSEFDRNCKELVNLIKSNPEIHKESDLFYVFDGFDGNTGYYLYHDLSDDDKKKYMHIAKYVLKTCS